MGGEAKANQQDLSETQVMYVYIERDIAVESRMSAAEPYTRHTSPSARPTESPVDHRRVFNGVGTRFTQPSHTGRPVGRPYS